MSNPSKKTISLEVEVENVMFNGNDILNDLSDESFDKVISASQNFLLSLPEQNEGSLMFYMDIEGKSCEVYFYFSKKESDWF